MPRRVVTGRDPSGKSVFVSDDEVAATINPAVPLSAYYEVWGVDGRYQLPSNGARPPCSTFFPPPEGFRYLVVQFQPDSTPRPGDLDEEALRHELEEKFPGRTEHMEPDHPGMHTTQTVDIGIVLSGELWLELDDGKEVRLGPGDMVVQNGTRHAWRNKSDQTCTAAFVLIGADKS
jgi:quercetin dioxygenase-like cupin family protein